MFWTWLPESILLTLWATQRRESSKLFHLTFKILHSALREMNVSKQNWYLEQVCNRNSHKYWNCTVWTRAVIVSTWTADAHERREHSSLNPLLWLCADMQAGRVLCTNASWCCPLLSIWIDIELKVKRATENKVSPSTAVSVIYCRSASGSCWGKKFTQYIHII